MPESRSMSNFIALPDGTLLSLNGAGLGEFIYGFRHKGSFLQMFFMNRHSWLWQ